MGDITTFPVQVPSTARRRRCNSRVVLDAYKVYAHVYGEQEAMVTGDCRGGFSAGELIAFLWAAHFPQREWRDRINEALQGMEGL